MVDNMQELKEKRIWMLWRWETKPDGKRTKVPMSVSGGPCGTDEKWHSSWATYDEAVAAKEKISNAAGIGFKIPEGFYFIDIDDREFTDPLVQTIFSRHDSYAEYSVSGTGIHQYGKCDFTKVPTYTDKNGKLCLDRQFYQKNPNNKMELYIGGITNRFAVYTGNVIETSLSGNVPQQSLSRWTRICAENRRPSTVKSVTAAKRISISSAICESRKTVRNSASSTTTAISATITHGLKPMPRSAR
jgi:primase-polymerase (primpol)-like protein